MVFKGSSYGENIAFDNGCEGVAAGTERRAAAAGGDLDRFFGERNYSLGESIVCKQ
ncbi:hypothetical protein D3C79_984930 [compost metagenome]